MSVRPPQDDAPTATDGDTSSTRGAGIMTGPIFYIAVGGVFAIIIVVMVLMAVTGASH
jgi:hypothetical protein